MLNSFEIRNFRAFRHLSIETFGRVNLVVGQNSVGKTTLLEALWLYASRVHPGAIRQLLVEREEVIQGQESESRGSEIDVNALFHGRGNGEEAANSFSLGPIDSEERRMTAKLIWLKRTPGLEPGTVSLEPMREGEQPSADTETVPAIQVSLAGTRNFYTRRYGSWQRSFRVLPGRKIEPYPPFLRAGGVDEETVAGWWDAVALRESEERITRFLRLLVPIERVTLVGNPGRYRGRIFLAKMRDCRLPQPLKSLGDGVERLFRVSLALEYARRSIDDTQLSLFPDLSTVPSASSQLFVDEIESGIHYAALAEYWRTIFALAQSLDVQVFATTHSWDCIQGFQAAAATREERDGMLIRLERGNGKTRAVGFTGRELAIATRESIEVR